MQPLLRMGSHLGTLPPPLVAPWLFPLVVPAEAWPVGETGHWTLDRQGLELHSSVMGGRRLGPAWERGRVVDLQAGGRVLCGQAVPSFLGALWGAASVSSGRALEAEWEQDME